jgi:hypothetical protein
VVDAKDILNWCFTIISINFGVFGFLYAIYVSATTAPTPEKPIRSGAALRVIPFCRTLAGIIMVLTALAAITCVQTGVGFATWLIVLCLTVLAIFAVWLAWTMS